MTHPTRYLFLDFDGVVHRLFPEGWDTDERNAHFTFVPEIARAILGQPFPVKIVITSTWRRKYDRGQLRGLLGPELGNLVVGTTPVHEKGNQEGGRLAEVRQWIEENAPDATWVALDDMPEMYSKCEGDDGVVALVHCPDSFEPAQTDELREALADPQRWAAKNPVPRL